MPRQTRRNVKMKIKVFDTYEEAVNYAIEEFGSLAVEMECVSITKVGPSIAKFLGTNCGWGVAGD